MKPSSSNLYQRHIRVFISSTFIGMEDEREYLISKVFPEIINKARQHNVIVTPVDLRWGITQQASENGETVKICLREIGNSQPYFIGILGNRYGWQPDYYDIIADPQTIEDFPWLKKDVEDKLSMTEIEIQYAALRNKSLIDAYFYISSKGSEDIRQKRLIKEVQENGRYPVCYYDNPQSLGEKIKTDFYRLLEERFPISKENSRHSMVKAAQDSILHKLLIDYVHRTEIESEIQHFISRHRKVVIKGVSGSGKSSLMANHIASNPQDNIISFFSSNGIDSGCITLKRYLINETERLLGLSSSDYYQDSELDKRLKELWNIISRSNKEVIYLIDGFTDDLSWLPISQNNIKLIVSSDNNNTAETLTFQGYHTYNIPVTSIEERTLIINKYLSRFRKDMPEQQVSDIARDVKSQDLNILKIMLNELIFNCEFKNYSKHIKDYTVSDTPYAYYYLVVSRMMEQFRFAKDLFAYIIYSKGGLYESHLLTLLKLSQQEWSQFFCCYNYIFSINNGLLTCANSKIKAIIETEFIADRSSITYIDQIIQLVEDELDRISKGQHIPSRQDMEAIMRVSLNMSPSDEDMDIFIDKMCLSNHLLNGRDWFYSELAHQYYICGYNDRLYSLLLNPIFTICFERNYRKKLITYWQYLRRSSANKYPFKATLNLDDDEYTDAFISDYYYSLALLSNELDISTDFTLKCIDMSLEYLDKTHEAYKRLAIIPRQSFKATITGDYSDLLYEHRQDNEYFSQTQPANQLNWAQQLLAEGNFHEAISVITALLQKLESSSIDNETKIEYRALGLRILGDANSAIYEQNGEEENFWSADKAYLSSLEIYESLHQVTPDKYAKDLRNVLNNYAILYHIVRNYDRAIDIYKLALMLYDKSTEQKEYAGFLTNYGGLLTDAARIKNKQSLYQEAYDILDEACDIYCRLSKRIDSNTCNEEFADALYNKARIIKLINTNGYRTYEIDIIYNRAEDLYRKNGSHYKLAHCYAVHASFSEEIGEKNQAIGLYQAAIDIYRTLYSETGNIQYYNKYIEIGKRLDNIQLSK